MIWAILTAAALFVLWQIFRKRPQQTSITPWAYIRADADRRDRGKNLPRHEQESFARDIRRLAHDGYDRVFSAAAAAGKDQRFANEAGVLDAIYCVSANANDLRTDDRVRRLLHLETVPFNTLGPEQSRAAVAEYLVWKYFPQQADMAHIRPAIEALGTFKLTLLDTESDPSTTLYEALHSGKWAWQELVADAVPISEKKIG